VHDVGHFIKGRLRDDYALEYNGFRTPPLDLDELVWDRSEPGPAFDTPSSEIIDFLVEVGRHLSLDDNELLYDAMKNSQAVSSLTPRIVEENYRHLGGMFDRDILEFQIEQELGSRSLIDGWDVVTDRNGREHRIRAFPPRLVHVVAGNSPGTSVITIVRGALSKGVHLIKMASNDLFTATAVLRTMATIDPGHPTTKSFSAVYWRGGDTAVEDRIFRSQYFDKLAAWGGESAITNAAKYIGPGFELVSFDPKISISLVGREAWLDDVAMKESTEGAALDINLNNQEACAASRFIYIEGTIDEVRPWCERLATELGIDRVLGDGRDVPVPRTVREEVDALRHLEPFYAVLGDFSTGVVVLSEAPVDFHPQGKVANVVVTPSLEEALENVTVATQSIGIYPTSRVSELRDALASRGMQRVTRLGEVASKASGIPHDGFYPLHRFVRWIVDDA
jgi:hypothetical protein